MIMLLGKSVWLKQDALLFVKLGLKRSFRKLRRVRKLDGQLASRYFKFGLDSRGAWVEYLPTGNVVLVV